MASVVVNGDTSGAVTLSAPAVAGTVTVTLPATSGTMLTTASSTGISGSAISSGTVPEAYGGTGTSTGYYGFKNKVINGAMQINQRAWSGTLTTNSTYTLDRWCYNGSLNSTISISQSTDAPTGFYNSLLVTSLANTTVGTSDFMGLQYIHEAQNLYDLQWQSSSPKTVTLSFWVKCSLVGTFGGSIRNSGAGGYSGYPFSYSIPTANTWTFITISVPVPVVTNGWGATNGYGMYMYFDLGTGTTYTAPANAWVAQNVVGANGTTKMVNTSGATWQFTGVQLEKGSTATSFDYRPYTTELQLCQRYYTFGNSYYQGNVYNFRSFPVTMRAAPTVTSSTALSDPLTYTDGFRSFTSGTQATTFTASIEL